MRPYGPLVVVCSLVCAAAVSVCATEVSAQTAAGSGTVVLWTSDVPSTDISGDWTRLADPTAAGSAALHNPNRSRSKPATALANPTNYFEMRFNVVSGKPYHLWVRLRAQNNATGNDSVHVQFTGSVNSAGQSIARIGTTQSAEVVLQNGVGGSKPLGWGWSDNGWGSPGTPIYFSSTGTQRVRIQQREDGVIVDQIILSPDSFLSASPGSRQNDTKIYTRAGGVASAPAAPGPDTVVIWTADIPDAQKFGSWTRVTDSTAAGQTPLRNPNASQPKVAPALASPSNYFETTFQAKAGTAYHVWMRMRAQNDSTANDSVHIQFNDSLTSGGAAFARIGTTASAEYVLQDGSKGAAPHAWGWTENGWGSFGAHVYFASTGTHRLRVQQREDGPTVDQIVISADTYLTRSPGFRRDDTTILAATGTTSSNQAPSVSLTAPGNGASFAAPATINLAASASDPENQLARVEFYAGTLRVGTDTTAPYTFSWPSVAAGSYVLSAVAVDAAGASTRSSNVSVTVAAPTTIPRTWTVVFTASSNHSTMVTSYLLEVFPAGANPATATPVATSNLGKPTPASNGDISVDRSTFFNGLAAGNYIATVSAVGSGGSSRSAPYSLTR